MKWQPISTAPKDGTEVLVYLEVAEVPVVHLAWYNSREEWDYSGQYCGGWDSLEDWEGWWSYTEGSVGQSKLEGYKAPTHWMPMPELAAHEMEVSGDGRRRTRPLGVRRKRRA